MYAGRSRSHSWPRSCGARTHACTHARTHARMWGACPARRPLQRPNGTHLLCTRRGLWRPRSRCPCRWGKPCSRGMGWSRCRPPTRCSWSICRTWSSAHTQPCRWGLDGLSQIGELRGGRLHVPVQALVLFQHARDSAGRSALLHTRITQPKAHTPERPSSMALRLPVQFAGAVQPVRVVVKSDEHATQPGTGLVLLPATDQVPRGQAPHASRP